MAKTSFGNTDIYKVSVGDLYNITKISIGDKLVYTAGNTVTYHVDTSLVYTEDVDADENVLSPKSFSPTKADWEFVGWRQDTNANATVETNLTMGDNPITLYAVFRKTITVTYYNPTVHTSVNYKYYNNSNSSNPKFTISPASYNGWTFRGWTKSSSPDGVISYTSISNTAISESITLYQFFEKTITLTLYNGSATKTTKTGKAYSNGSNTVYPKFSVTATTISGWTFRGWSTSSVGNAGISYNAISNTAFSSNTTLYALYQTSITLSYNANGGTGSIAADSGIRYYNSIGSYINPTFTVKSNSYSKSGYNFSRWRLNGLSGTAYSPGASLQLSASATLYAEWVDIPLPTSATMTLPTMTKTTLSTGGYSGRCTFTINVGTKYAGKKVRWKMNLPSGFTILTNDYLLSGSSAHTGHKIGNILCTNSAWRYHYHSSDGDYWAYWKADNLTDVSTVGSDGVIRIPVTYAQPEYNGYTPDVNDPNALYWAFAEKVETQPMPNMANRYVDEIFFGYGYNGNNMNTVGSNRLRSCSVTLTYA